MKNLPKIFLVFIFLFTNTFVNGQNVDSLKIELSESESFDDNINVMVDLASAYLQKNLDSTLHYTDLIINLAQKEKKIALEAKAFYLKARAYNKKGDYENALSAIDESRVLYRSINDTKGLAQSLSIFGNIFQNKRDYKLANSYFDSSLMVAKQIQDSALIMANYGNLAISYDYSGQYDKAIEYYFIFRDYLEREGNLLDLSKVYANIGVVYYFTKQMKKSIEYYNKSIEIKRRMKNYGGLSLTFNNLSNVYIAKKNWSLAKSMVDSAIVNANKINSEKQNLILLYKKAEILENEKMFNQAIKLYKSGLKIALKKDDKYNIAVGKTNIGQLLCKMNNFYDGEKYLNEALVEAKSVNDIYLEKHILKNLISLYNGKKEYKNITGNFKRLIEIQDSLYSKQKIKKITEIETKYQTQKKEAENQILKKDKELLLATTQKQKITIWSTIAGLSLFSILAFMLYRQNKLKQKANKLLSEKNEKIELLHKELSHRVKNNLAFISGLMRMQGRRLENVEAIQAVKEGEARIEAMSLLHRKLYLQEDTQVNMEEYLEELCGNLQNTYPFQGKKPKINMNIENITVDGETAMRIGLIVNELVTNSFKYAFADIQNPQIDINLTKKDNEKYTLKYYDNGKGLPAEFDISKTKSLGLKLIYTLTKQLNGKLEIENKDGTYFTFNFIEKKIA